MNGPAPPLPRTHLLWLRWSWRDLRSHWVAVVTIALVMAIGVGVYAGLGSTAAWRRQSNDASFTALAMHDVRAVLSPGTFAAEGSLIAAIASIESAGSVSAVEERLVVDSQADVPTPEGSVLVAARVVGMDLVDAAVDEVWVRDGSSAEDGGDAGAAAVLEAKFADHWDLQPGGSLTVAGEEALRYAGVGAIPEDFYYAGPEGSVFSQGELAPLYLPLAHAQDLLDRPGQVNDVVLGLAAGTDVAVVESQLAEALGGLGVSATVTDRDDAEAVRVLYEDIDNDQRIWNAIAGLVLFAAALAAFNLINRIVEAQRREIGIGMALGVPRRQLAIRPMLVAAQIAVLSTFAGAGVGLLMGDAMAGLLETFLPLPVYRTPFQSAVFATAALLAVVIPIAAAALPVWRAVRVEPIEAIRTGHLTAKTSRLTDVTGRLRLPGSSLTQMPVRNLLRTPRRTVLTAMGVGAAITAVVGVLGMLDSFTRTIDEVGDELAGGDPDRVIVQLDTFHPVDSEVVTRVAETPSVGTIETGLRLPATGFATTGNDDLELLLETVDLTGGAWMPTLEGTTDEPASGVILARKAADDLGVELGELVTLRHPVRRDDGTFAVAQSQLPLSAIHANPLRTFAYVDVGGVEGFGFAGFTNVLQVSPADGATRAQLQRDVFALPGVTSSQAVARISEGFDDALSQFVGFLVIAAVAVLTLAVLIAFNAIRISVEERRREHATMQAFGLPVRSILGVVVKESVVIGAIATVMGVAAGLVFLEWMLRSLGSTTLPDLGMVTYLSPATLAIAATVGVAAVAVAPLLLTRRIRRMNIPDTLRVME